MTKHSLGGFDGAIKAVALCMVVAPVSDILFLVVYFVHRMGMGYPFLYFGGLESVMGYLRTWYGMTLLALGIVPYLVALFLLRWSSRGTK